MFSITFLNLLGQNIPLKSPTKDQYHYLLENITFHCHCNIPKYTKLLYILNFPIEMFMHVYISHSKRAITISFFVQHKPS